MVAAGGGTAMAVGSSVTVDEKNKIKKKMVGKFIALKPSNEDFLPL